VELGSGSRYVDGPVTPVCIPAGGSSVVDDAAGRSSYPADRGNDQLRKHLEPHVENLRVYLGRQVSAKGAPRALVVEAVAALRDPDTARVLFREVENARLPALLSRLGDYEDDLPIEAAMSIPVLFELRTRLPERGIGFFDIDPEIRIGSVIYRIFKGSPPEAVAQMVEQVLPQGLLSDRLSLLRTLGWRAESAERLASDEDFERQANAVVDEALKRSGQELADEHELASLVYYVGQARSAEEVSQWAVERVDWPLFALSLIASNRSEVRNSAGRHVQLSWDKLTDLLGEQTLVDLIKQLPEDSAWPRALSPDETELLRQATSFADDPSEARNHMEAYRRQYPS
jgi:hypothetical protein